MTAGISAEELSQPQLGSPCHPVSSALTFRSWRSWQSARSLRTHGSLGPRVSLLAHVALLSLGTYQTAQHTCKFNKADLLSLQAAEHLCLGTPVQGLASHLHLPFGDIVTIKL